MASKEFFTEYFKVNHVHLVAPNSQNEGQEKKYGIQMMFPKTGQMPANIANQSANCMSIFDALDEVCMQEFNMKYQEAVQRLGIQNPPSYKDGDLNFKKDGDGIPTTEVHEFTKGMHLINVRNRDKVGVCDHVPQDADPSIVYSGAWCRAGIEAQAYKNNAGQFVIALTLLSVQKAYDDTQIGGKTVIQSASNHFAGMAVSDSNCQSTGYQAVAQTSPSTPSVPGAPVQPSTPAVKQLVQVPGAQYTIEQCKQSNWTDEQIVQAGYAKWEEQAAPPTPATPAGPGAPPTPVASTPQIPGATGSAPLPGQEYLTPPTPATPEQPATPAGASLMPKV